METYLTIHELKNDYKKVTHGKISYVSSLVLLSALKELHYKYIIVSL